MAAQSSEPVRACRSEPQIPHRSTRKRTCPRAGTGSGSSSTRSSACWQTTAFMGRHCDGTVLERGASRDAAPLVSLRAAAEPLGAGEGPTGVGTEPVRVGPCDRERLLGRAVDALRLASGVAADRLGPGPQPSRVALDIREHLAGLGAEPGGLALRMRKDLGGRLLVRGQNALRFPPGVVELGARLRPRPVRFHTDVRPNPFRLGCRLRPHFLGLGARLRADALGLGARLRADPLAIAARLVADLLAIAARLIPDLLGIRSTLLANRLEVMVDAIGPFLRLGDHADRLRVGIAQQALGLGARLLADPLRFVVSRRPQLLALSPAGIDQGCGVGLRRGTQLLDLGASSVEHGGGIALSRGAELGGLLLRRSAPLGSLALGLRRLLPRLREPAAPVLLDRLENPFALVEMVLDLPSGLVHPALGEPGAHPLQVLLDLISIVSAPYLAEVSLDDENGHRLGSSAHTRRASSSLAGVLLSTP